MVIRQGLMPALPEKLTYLLLGIDVRRQLADAITSINANHTEAELCILTGDLTHSAESNAYSVLIEIMDDIHIPWHPLIGNHDTRETAQSALPHISWSEDGFLQYILDTTAGIFVVLDISDPGKASGRLCEDRLRWVA